MAITSPVQSFPIAEGTDAPNEPAQLAAAVNAIEKQVVMVFPDVATRNAKLTGVNAAKEGMVCWIKNTDSIIYFDGATWRSFGDYWLDQTTGIGPGPAPVIGKTKFEVADYHEDSTGDDGKLFIPFPSGFTSLVSFQLSEADGGSPLMANHFNLYILPSSSDASHGHVQARNNDGTAMGSKWVGMTYHVVLQ